ncbi:MAG: hypothetical protein NXI04_07835 [Planctomycetaceae bacterium]|nr:hypothetical protein [Planctomycetaceae bacterium]
MPTLTDQRLAIIAPLLNRLIDRLRIGRSPAVRADIQIRAVTALSHSAILRLMLELLEDERFAPVAAYVLECDGTHGRARSRFLPSLAAVYNVPHIDSYDESRAKWFLQYGINFDELVLT